MRVSERVARHRPAGGGREGKVKGFAVGDLGALPSASFFMGLGVKEAQREWALSMKRDRRGEGEL